MTEQSLPRGWDPERVRRVLAHYDSQTEEEAFAEDESAMEGSSHTVVEVPEELMPTIREVIARYEASRTS